MAQVSLCMEPVVPWKLYLQQVWREEGAELSRRGRAAEQASMRGRKPSWGNVPEKNQGSSDPHLLLYPLPASDFLLGSWMVESNRNPDAIEGCWCGLCPSVSHSREEGGGQSRVGMEKLKGRPMSYIQDVQYIISGSINSLLFLRWIVFWMSAWKVLMMQITPVQ